MYEALYEACEAADGDDDVRAVVLRGAGGKAFVAGTDIGQFTAFESGEDGLEYEATIDRIVGRLEAVRKPTVALVHGYAPRRRSRSASPPRWSTTRRRA